MRLLAIDPGSNKCGLASFENGILFQTQTIASEAKTPLTRRLEIAQVLSGIVTNREVTSEEPLLLGRNNNGMQRLLGCIEFVTEGRVSFIHPMTLKKFLGSGKLDKLEVALAVGNLLKTEQEQEIVADAISREAWDETDAVAVGLAYLGRNP